MQDSPAWGQYHNKQPTGNLCYLDKCTLVEGWPQLSEDEAQKKYHSDAAWKGMFLGVQRVKKAQILNLAPPMKFPTPSEVEYTTARAISVYYEVGFVTESDITRITSMTAAALGLKKTNQTTVTVEDGTQVAGWIVSLEGVPSEELAAMRKLRLEQRVASQHSQLLLPRGKQLRQDQGIDMFNLISAKQLEDECPSSARPSSRGSVSSLAKLKRKAEGILQDRLCATPLSPKLRP